MQIVRDTWLKWVNDARLKNGLKPYVINTQLNRTAVIWSESAKKKGKKFGRPDALNEKDKEMTLAMFNGGATKIDISRHFNVTRQTIYTILKEYETRSIPDTTND